MNTSKQLSTINNDDERSKRIFQALKNNVYPGVKDETVDMIIDYCKSLKLDPMMKPVHPVPMSVKDSKSGDFSYRDVIMNGIGLYRTVASRSEKYLGVTKPEFGKDITEELDGVKITYPEWCLMYIKLKVNGEIIEIPSLVYWKESYATANSRTTAPNKMWIKRPRGQLIKCTEANAYRMAFPDTLGSTVTFEEIEGKTELSKDVKILDDFPISGNEKLRREIDITPDVNKDNFLINEFTMKIENSNSKEELDTISNEIKKCNFNEEEKGKLRNFFAGRLDQMKKFNTAPIKNTVKGNL